jgi:hypothetical protein
LYSKNEWLFRGVLVGMPLMGSFTMNILITPILAYSSTREKLYYSPAKNGGILAGKI